MITKIPKYFAVSGFLFIFANGLYELKTMYIELKNYSNMKQSIISILLALLMSMFGATAFAHDFSAENQDGVTIYYNYIGDYTGGEVSATYCKPSVNPVL